MKTLTIIWSIFVHSVGFSQTDTIRVDLHDLSINFKTCECFLFGGCRSYSYPVKADWKRADSLFICNQDTIYFVLTDHGLVKIEGLKKPEGEACGKINFYNKHSELVKTEIWEAVFLDMENGSASWSDGYYWAKQMHYKKGILISEIIRSIVFDEKKGFGQKTEIIYRKGSIIKRIKTKIQFY